MANYTASARSNQFEVKDPDALRRELADLDIDVVSDDPENPQRVVLLCHSDNGTWPSWRYDEPADNDIEVDVAALIAAHLTAGQVAVLIESGAEKLRFIGGHAVAVNSRGEQVDVSLEEIYERANRLGDHIDRI